VSYEGTQKSSSAVGEAGDGTWETKYGNFRWGILHNRLDLHYSNLTKAKS